MPSWLLGRGTLILSSLLTPESAVTPHNPPRYVSTPPVRQRYLLRDYGPTKNLISSSTRRGFYPQRSSGQAVVTGVVPFPPRYMPSVFIAHRVQHTHCSWIFTQCYNVTFIACTFILNNFFFFFTYSCCRTTINSIPVYTSTIIPGSLYLPRVFVLIVYFRFRAFCCPRADPCPG